MTFARTPDQRLSAFRKWTSGPGLTVAVFAVAALAVSPALAAARAENIPPPSVEIPAPPPLVLSSHVLEAASEYRAYLHHMTALSSQFESGQAIEAELADAAAFEPQQLLKGAVAYSAVIALQDPAFVAGVRVYASNAAMRKDVADRIMSDPNYVTVMPGAATAAHMIMATMNDHGERITAVGGRIKQAAYDIQKQKSWSKNFVTDREGRLARAKSLSAAPMTPVPDELRGLTDALTGSEAFAAEISGVSGDPAQQPFTPFVVRSLAVAALAALGEGGEENEPALQGLLNESSGGFCLNMTKLNLYQCLAVAKPFYEDMFCMGQHALMDTGECIAKAAGSTASAASASQDMARQSAPKGPGGF